jgi:UDP-2-acetamido-3-amino-2,3-dideoxy-glucuronate N-acetyltransferase
MTALQNERDLALVGAGYWGKNLARNFHALGVLHTLCDRSAATLQAYGTDYAGVRRCQDFDEVLRDAAITKIAIAAPAALHYPLAKAALLAGKDVFVEKPLCLELADAEDLVAVADRHKRVLMVGHLLQYHPAVEELRRMVATGELGRLQYITSNRLNLGKIRQEENALWSFAPHDISVILALAGGQMPQRVRCTGESYLTKGVADTTLTAMRFADGLQAHVFVSWLNPFKEQKLTVVGSRGMVVFDDTKPWQEKLAFHRDYLTWSDGRTPTASKALTTFVTVSEVEPLGRECAHFLECCRTRARPRTDGREGVQVLRLLKAAQASLDRDGEAANPYPVMAPDFFAHPSAVVSPEAKIGAGTKIWHFCHVMPGAELGRNCNLGQNVVVSPGVKLGENVKVQNNVSIYTGTIVEDDVFLGPSCVLTNVSNPRSQVNRRGLYEKTLIRRGATIGANATIVCGTALGRYCFVAAGAVVTKDVPDYALMVGSPARRRGWMSRHGHPLRTRNQEGQWVCPESGFRYAENSAGELRCLDLDENAALPPHHAVGTKSFRECNVPST